MLDFRLHSVRRRIEIGKLAAKNQDWMLPQSIVGDQSIFLSRKGSYARFGADENY